MKEGAIYKSKNTGEYYLFVKHAVLINPVGSDEYKIKGSTYVDLLFDGEVPGCAKLINLHTRSECFFCSLTLEDLEIVESNLEIIKALYL